MPIRGTCGAELVLLQNTAGMVHDSGEEVGACACGSAGECDWLTADRLVHEVIAERAGWEPTAVAVEVVTDTQVQHLALPGRLVRVCAFCSFAAPLIVHPPGSSDTSIWY